jgi:hypothetical protein
MTNDQIQRIILDKLSSLEEKVDTMIRDGCSKASTHNLLCTQQEGIFKRLRELEISQAEGKGKLAITVGVATSALTAFLSWLFRQI